MTLLAAPASAIPVEKPIDQTIADYTRQQVQDLCCAFTPSLHHDRNTFAHLQTNSDNDDQCNTISWSAFTTLLAAGKNGDQQDVADRMVDLAKQLNNNADIIRLAQILVQQPKNAMRFYHPSYTISILYQLLCQDVLFTYSLQVPCCQQEPKNQGLMNSSSANFSATWVLSCAGIACP